MILQSAGVLTRYLAGTSPKAPSEILFEDFSPRVERRVRVLVLLYRTPPEILSRNLWCTPRAGAKAKVSALLCVGVPTLRQRGEGSMREPPTAAAERRKVCYVPMLRRRPATSNADELDAVPKRQSSLPR